MPYTQPGMKFGEGTGGKKKEDKFLKEQKEEAVKSTDYLEKLPNPTTKAIKSKSTLDDSSDHDMGNLEDKMRDEGVFSIGKQKND